MCNILCGIGGWLASGCCRIPRMWPSCLLEISMSLTCLQAAKEAQKEAQAAKAAAKAEKIKAFAAQSGKNAEKKAKAKAESEAKKVRSGLQVS